MGRAYQKGEPHQAPRETSQSAEEQHEKAELDIRDVPKPYKKEDGTLDPALFIIISGGEKREKDYFSFFQGKYHSFPRIDVQFIDKDESGTGGLDVDRLVNLALTIKKQKEASKSTDITDSIHIVTDVDHFYSQIVKNTRTCTDNDIKLVVSNPCFEVWLYYSYFSELPDFEVPENKLKTSKQFKTYNDTQKKGGIDPRKAPQELKNAITNAKAHYWEDHNGVPELFATQMIFLAEELLKLTMKEIEQFKAIEEQRRRKYQK